MNVSSTSYNELLHWLADKIRLKLSPKNDSPIENPVSVHTPRHYLLESATEDENSLLLLALAPHLLPGFYDALIREHLPDGGDFP